MSLRRTEAELRLMMRELDQKPSQAYCHLEEAVPLNSFSGE